MDELQRAYFCPPEKADPRLFFYDIETNDEKVWKKSKYNDINERNFLNWTVNYNRWLNIFSRTYVFFQRLAQR